MTRPSSPPTCRQTPPTSERGHSTNPPTPRPTVGASLCLWIRAGERSREPRAFLSRMRRGLRSSLPAPRAPHRSERQEHHRGFPAGRDSVFPFDSELVHGEKPPNNHRLDLVPRKNGTSHVVLRHSPALDIFNERGFDRKQTGSARLDSRLHPSHSVGSGRIWRGPLCFRGRPAYA